MRPVPALCGSSTSASTSSSRLLYLALSVAREATGGGAAGSAPPTCRTACPPFCAVVFGTAVSCRTVWEGSVGFGFALLPPLSAPQAPPPARPPTTPATVGDSHR